MAYKILSVLLSVGIFLVLVTNFMNAMAGVLVITGSLCFMWVVADFFMWLFERGDKCN